MKARTWNNILSNTAGVVCMLLGILVITGWYSHSLSLIQVLPQFALMPFNPALCFVLSGLVLLFLSKKQLFVTRILCILIFIIAGITLFEYILNIRIGIDELFIKAYVSATDKYPGRMAPNTAFGFALFAISSFIVSWSSSHHALKLALAINLIIICLGLLAMFGYFTELTTRYGFGQWIKMALHTALGLFILSFGLIAHINRVNNVLHLSLIPLVVGFIFLLLSFLGWQLIKKEQELHLNTLLLAKINNVSSLLLTHFEERALSFSKISYRWLSQKSGTPKDVWEADVKHYINDQPGYVAIEFVDENYIVRWVEPKKGNEQVIGFNVNQDANRRQVIKKSLEEKKLKLSKQLDLIQGGKGILFFSPLVKENEFHGFMIGVISTKQILSTLLAKADISKFQLTISDKTGILYSTATLKNEKYKAWEKKRIIQLYGQNWEISLKPTTALYNMSVSPVLPSFALLIGIMISILSYIVVESFLSIRRLQARARNANERLNGIIEGSSDYIAAIDLNYNFIVFNSIYRNEIFRLLRVNLKPGMNFSELTRRMGTDNAEKSTRLWNKALSGKSFTVVETFDDKTIKGLAFEIRYNPIRDADGNLIGASHIATNIYSRLKNEKKLTSYRNQLEQLVEDLAIRNEALQLLKEFSSILQTNSSLEEATQTIESYMKKLLTNTSGIMYLVLESNQTDLEAQFEWGSVIAKKQDFDTNSCFALLRYQPYIVLDTSETIVCKHIKDSSQLPQSYVCFPLVTQKKLIGLLYVELDANEKDQQRVIDFGQIVSEQISLSLYNITLQESLKTQSTIDSLTELYNRRFFEEYVKKELAKSQRYPTKFGILLLDIDDFKKINDTYGHIIGDKVLRKLAELMRNNFRENDIIARWGGEEFIVFLQEITKEDLQEKADALRFDAERSKIRAHSTTISFTISVGATLFSNDHDMDLLTKRTDEALYEAKRTGKNKVIIHTDES